MQPSCEVLVFYGGPRPLCAGPGLAELHHDLGGDVPSGYGDGVRGVGELGDLDELEIDRSLSYIYYCQTRQKKLQRVLSLVYMSLIKNKFLDGESELVFYSQTSSGYCRYVVCSGLAISCENSAIPLLSCPTCIVQPDLSSSSAVKLHCAVQRGSLGMAGEYESLLIAVIDTCGGGKFPPPSLPTSQETKETSLPLPRTQSSSGSEDEDDEDEGSRCSDCPMSASDSGLSR